MQPQSEPQSDPAAATAPAGATAPAEASVAPVSEKQRYRSIDVVRGFALLGILVPNIIAFAWPSTAMSDPAFMNDTLGHSDWNRIGHDITSIFTLGKMMALFSMLFGAGVVIFDRKPTQPQAWLFPALMSKKRRMVLLVVGYFVSLQAAKLLIPWPVYTLVPATLLAMLLLYGLVELSHRFIWYRRTAWLLLIGVLHATMLWYGDILVAYALAGVGAVWWVRRWNPKLQIAVGIAGHLLSTLLMLGFSMLGVLAVQNGKIGPDELMGDPAMEMQGYIGSYLETFKPRLYSLFFFWALYLPLFYPGITGLMMIGMGLTRLGILTGERSTRFYAGIAIMGLIGGLGLTTTVYYGIQHLMPDLGGFLWMSFSQFIGIPISLGYMGLLIWLVRINALRWLTAGLANIGRMALSNYLLHTIVCTTVFYGYGGGFFAEIAYPGLFGVIAGVWCINFVFSAVWLRFFRFGPAEWAWRSATYWKLQPLRR